jgi:prepilin-type N-terminal cleavage/methylation domain-containing protein
MTKTIKFAGFTLIELLIVIGLLAALAAVLLPSLMGSKEDALAGLDKYNAAGSLRTLRQYEVITGGLPNGMHSGLTDGGVALMPGVTSAYTDNVNRVSNLGSVVALTDDEVDALADIGITDLAYGLGNKNALTRDGVYGYEALSGTSKVVTMDANWKDENGSPITFNGKGFAALQAEGYTKIINVFLTPTADWSAQSNNGWVKGFNIGMDIPGTCPIVDDEFSYYTVFIGIKAAGFANITSSVSGDAPPVTGLQIAAPTLADAKAAVEAWVTAAPNTTIGTWDTTDPDLQTVTADYVNSGDTGVITFTVAVSDEGEAKLLGTSCPEHGVTNP